MEADIYQQLALLAADLPVGVVHRLAAVFDREQVSDWEKFSREVLSVAVHPQLKRRLATFLSSWREHADHVKPQSAAMALRTALSLVTTQRSAAQIELVWTGPITQSVAMRRTDQALLELIDTAKSTLHLASFAVYRAERIVEALVAAGQRRVRVNLYLETIQSGSDKMAYDTVAALGDRIRSYAHIYHWPVNRRATTSDGRYGSLHAKVAVADGRLMFISSANLTEYAMDLNIEAGLLVESEELANRVEQYLEQLVLNDVFIPLS